MVQNIESQDQLSRRGLVKHKTNPFIADACVNTKIGVKTIKSKLSEGGKNDGKMLVTNTQTGEVAEAGFWHTQEVDKSQFVKLYINGVKAFKDLTGAGTKVFEILYREIQNGIGKDVVYLSFQDVDQDLTPMSKMTYSRGMKELLEKGFIAETMVQGKYFINPDYVFNGDRLTFVREYRKSSVQQAKDQSMRNALEAAGQKRLVQ